MRDDPGRRFEAAGLGLYFVPNELRRDDPDREDVRWMLGLR
jgi:hypothetical protein